MQSSENTAKQLFQPRAIRRGMVAALGWALVLAPLSRADAEHGSPVMVEAPQSGSTIPRNSLIRLQSYNGVHYTIEDLTVRPPKARAYLEAGGHRVSLKKLRFFDDQEGGYGDSVLVMKPTRLLRAGATYRLYVEYMTKTNKPVRYELANWKVGRAIDRKSPRWRGRPALGRTTSRYRSGRRIIVSMAREGLSEMIVDLIPVGKGTRKQVILVFDRSRWCKSGATVHYPTAVVRAHCPTGKPAEACHTGHVYQTQKDVGQKYRVRLTAVDIAGNSRRAPGNWPVYVWPKEQDVQVCWRNW